MKSLLSVLLAGVALIAACGGAAGATARPAPPAPTTLYKSTLPGQIAGAPIDLIQNVLDFAPGAASTVHVHTSPNLGTVLAGQITVKKGSGDRHATAGDSLVEPINEPVQAVNDGNSQTMVAVAFPVVHGAKPTAAVPNQPTPVVPNQTLYTFTLPSLTLSGGYSVVQQVLEFAPRAETPKHRHGGPGVVTVLEGDVTLVADGVEKTYNVGESFTEQPGQTLQAMNAGGAKARVVATFLLPDGAQLTTNL